MVKEIREISEIVRYEDYIYIFLKKKGNAGWERKKDVQEDSGHSFRFSKFGFLNRTIDIIIWDQEGTIGDKRLTNPRRVDSNGLNHGLVYVVVGLGLVLSGKERTIPEHSSWCLVNPFELVFWSIDNHWCSINSFTSQVPVQEVILPQTSSLGGSSVFPAACCCDGTTNAREREIWRYGCRGKDKEDDHQFLNSCQGFFFFFFLFVFGGC